MARRTGKKPSLQPMMKTVSNSRPFEACPVISSTLLRSWSSEERMLSLSETIAMFRRKSPRDTRAGACLPYAGAPLLSSKSTMSSAENSRSCESSWSTFRSREAKSSSAVGCFFWRCSFSAFFLRYSRKPICSRTRSATATAGSESIARVAMSMTSTNSFRAARTFAVSPDSAPVVASAVSSRIASSTHISRSDAESVMMSSDFCPILRGGLLTTRNTARSSRGFARMRRYASMSRISSRS
mmetsp:Transcript_15578/g.41946  ORF Transcript_15578/g.41946 Transcript_15578/m.41946 type:complete len:241 (-) Transcript_15578:1977-2699(-)